MTGEPEGKQAHRTRRVLIVEDEAVVGIYLTELLEEMGLEVCGVAATTAAALELAAASEPDVALVDIGLRGHPDGVAAAAAIAERHGTAIVFLSGDPSAASEERVRALAPVAFLAKPYLQQDLEAALARAFARD